METTTGATVPVPTQAEEQEDQKVLKILEDLKKEGFYLSKKGIHEILNSYEEMPSLDEIKKAIINFDFRLIGTKSISPIKGTTNSVDGPIVLQVTSVVNVLRSSRSQGLLDTNSTFTADRILVLRMTDGANVFKTLEANPPLKCLSGILPGTKVRLTGKLEVRNCMILLTAENTEVLGGKVDKIVSEWRAERLQRRFKGVTGAPKFVALTPEDVLNKKKQPQTITTTATAAPQKSVDTNKKPTETPKEPQQQQQQQQQAKSEAPKKSVSIQRPVTQSNTKPQQQQQKSHEPQHHHQQQQQQQQPTKSISIVRKTVDTKPADEAKKPEEGHKLSITRKVTTVPPQQQQQQNEVKSVVSLKIVRKQK